MDPSAEYIRIFSELARKNQPVKLYNTYRGVPISYEAYILSVDPWYITTSVHEFQAVCLALDNVTHIQSDLLPEVLRSRSITVDIRAKEARLTEFVLAGQSVGKRTTVRVQPKEPIDVEIFDAGRRVPAIVADMSTNGIGVVTFAAYIYGNIVFERGAEVFANLRLPGSEELIRFQGRIASVNPKGKYTHRLGLTLDPSSNSEGVLKKYIAIRQEEILVELKGVYESMCAAPRKKTGPIG